jgi:hypothetical protein
MSVFHENYSQILNLKKTSEKKVPGVFSSVDNAQLLCHNPVTFFYTLSLKTGEVCPLDKKMLNNKNINPSTLVIVLYMLSQCSN